MASLFDEEMGTGEIQPFTNYYFSWRCDTCGQEIGAGGPCGCLVPPPQPQPRQGWLCPACGGGNAPWKGRCDCVDVPVKFTISSTSEEEDNG